MKIIQPRALLGLTLVLLIATLATPAGAGSWDLAISGIIGGSFPKEINGFRQVDPAGPTDLTIDGLVSKDALVLGGRVSAFNRRDHGVEWGVNVDVRSFEYDGVAGHPIHLSGMIDGEPLDVDDVSTADDSRVTMFLGAFVLRWPMGRSDALPRGRWFPYIGVGGGIQHIEIKAPPPAFGSNGGTFQVLAGAEVLVAPGVGLFGEYRFERIKDEFEIPRTTTGIGTIRPRTHHLAGGVSIHF